MRLKSPHVKTCSDQTFLLPAMTDTKRANGRYYTCGDPFSNAPFKKWARQAGLPGGRVLEPFAGGNSLIKMLSDRGLCKRSSSFDIAPANAGVKRRDTLRDFPRGCDICVTNPPWLAKNSATVRGLAFPQCRYDDLYKYALGKCLDNCPYVAALIPESFITANLFQDRLQSFVSLTARMFYDTGHPAGLALFVPDPVCDVEVWSGSKRVGPLSRLRKRRPKPEKDGIGVKFNVADGNVGLIALDNTKEASIRFCDVAELAGYQVKPTGRHITKLMVNGPIRIAEWNEAIQEFRDKTWDVLMTCYKGIRKDGKYRRRCDWSLARGVIHHVR